MLNKLGGIDIYLLDQIMKGRIRPDMRILDAGCGTGRNCEFLIREGFNVFGIDQNPENIAKLKTRSNQWLSGFDNSHFRTGKLSELPYGDAAFDFIICNAVLHFASSRDHFQEMFTELMRILDKAGILFIRMTSKHTMDGLGKSLGDDIYQLPDGSTRYLLDLEVLEKLMLKHQLRFLEPLKTVNVSDLRSMTTLVLYKIA